MIALLEIILSYLGYSLNTERITRQSVVETLAMDYEADRLEHRINVVTDESLAATHRIRQVAEETNQIGVDTLGTLQDQGEQLDRIENQVDKIEVDLKGTSALASWLYIVP